MQNSDLEILTDLIKKSSVIGDFEKEDFLAILPSLNEEQTSELLKFFMDSEDEISKLTSDHQNKKNSIYASHVSKLTEAFKEAKQVIHTGKASISAKHMSEDISGMLTD